MELLDQVWAGVDVGKTHHWVCVIDPTGKVLLSVKVANDETDLQAVIAKATGLARQVRWAVDIIGAPSALLLTLLIQAGQPVRYASGRVVAAMSAAFTGEGKTLRTHTSSPKPQGSAATSPSSIR